jgi:hypothetical protein
MPGCDCQHCAKDNDGVRRTANRIFNPLRPLAPHITKTHLEPLPNRIVARAQSRSAGPTNGGGRAHSENGAGTRCVAAPATSLLRT